MAAPSSTKWGSVKNDKGRIGINITLTETASTIKRKVDVWFWSKWSVDDTNNNVYFNCGTGISSASTRRKSATINHTVASGGGWSTSNQTKIYSATKTYNKGAKDVKYKVYAKLSGIEAVGYIMTANTTFTVPAAASCTISYNANGGDENPSSTTAIVGQASALTTIVPTREGYTFAGWCLNANGTGDIYQPGAKVTVSANTTYHAIWTATGYIISYNLNGGTGTIGNQIKTNNVNINITSIVPTREGYNFSHWNGASAEGTILTPAPGAVYSLNESITLNAVWTPWTHTIAFNSEGGSAISSIVKTTGVDCYIPSTAPVKTGYSFQGWITALGAEDENAEEGQLYLPGDLYNINQNGGTVTLHALWEDKNIRFYNSYDCECMEIIEDNRFGFYKDGTIHCLNFIEEDNFLSMSSSNIKANSFIEK